MRATRTSARLFFSLPSTASGLPCQGLRYAFPSTVSLSQRVLCLFTGPPFVSVSTLVSLTGPLCVSSLARLSFAITRKWCLEVWRDVHSLSPQGPCIHPLKPSCIFAQSRCRSSTLMGLARARACKARQRAAKSDYGIVGYGNRPFCKGQKHSILAIWMVYCTRDRVYTSAKLHIAVCHDSIPCYTIITFGSGEESCARLGLLKCVFDRWAWYGLSRPDCCCQEPQMGEPLIMVCAQCS
jgi:hypothetical protein